MKGIRDLRCQQNQNSIGLEFCVPGGIDRTGSLYVVPNRREQYYWVRYWYWVILGCFRTIGIGIVKGFSKYWYWYWVLLRAFQSIGIGIGYC